MYVIGTAGHVDHGKSSLVKALTGIHPDRLKEEIQREMTIELGFAWMELPDVGEVGIVDVPGHRDFIENMLAGVGGIDAVILVIAADEGVMPQTHEHLAILDILKIRSGLIALTKIDLVKDAEWLEMLENDIRQMVKNTILENAPILQVSSKTGIGINELKKNLVAILQDLPGRPDLNRARLPIDRVFSISGFGTVVTGTLLDGCLHLGDEIEIVPAHIKGRIRGLQSYQNKTEVSYPGSRTAVNISGINIDLIARGDVLVQPGKYQTTKMIDVNFTMLKDVSSPLRHNSVVKLFIGAAEILARVRVLGVDELQPGQTGWLQLDLKQPIVSMRGDHYILRKPSPGETLGGGVIMDPFPSNRHKRYDQEVLKKLNTIEKGSPEEIILSVLENSTALSTSEIIKLSRLPEDVATESIGTLILQNRLVQLSDPNSSKDSAIVTSEKTFRMLSEKIIQEIQKYLKANPLRNGMPKEELKEKLRIESKVFQLLVKTWIQNDHLKDLGSLLTTPGYQVQFSSIQQARINQLLEKFSIAPFSPPTIKECQEVVGSEVYLALVDQKVLITVSDEVVYKNEDYLRLIEETKTLFSLHPLLTLGEFRDLMKISRRYAQAFLEHMDAIGITIREGDVRKLKILQK
jgi:selenocysteine-specific elongation factor